MMRLLRLLPFAATLLLLTGCPSAPTQLLQEASQALNNASLARKCAPEEFEAAQQAFQKANDLAAAEKYDEAEEMARAAKKLAAKAEQKALLRKEDCLNPKTDPNAIDPNELVEQQPGETVQMNEEDGLKTIYFDFNAAELTEAARAIVASNAAWIREHTAARVTIEGHCDNRGASEYNLALGEQRALVVRKYLEQLGVNTGNIEVVSYGEEQPEDYGETDAAHARNRRATFRTR